MESLEERFLIQTYQQPLSGRHHLDISCKAGQVKYRQCVIPLISILSAVIAAIVIFTRLLQPLNRYRPNWMRPFVSEFNDKTIYVQLPKRRRYTTLTKALLAILPIGLAIQIVAALYPTYDLTEIFPTLAWVCRSNSSQDQYLCNDPRPLLFFSLSLTVQEPRRMHLSSYS